MNGQTRQSDLDATRSQLLGEQINVGLLDQVVEALSTSDPEERKQANELLCEIKADPNSWLKVDTILDNSKNDSTKYIALQILEDAIRTRWRSLPDDQRTGIREFIVTKIADLSPNTLSSDYILNKMNLVLVQIVKKDWPHRWPSFINDLLSFAGSCRGSCVNSLNIFSLLSEEVFDFGGQNMTQAEERNLKETFCRQFEDVYAFCSRCLSDCPTNEIITAVLKTIRRFLSWIPTPTVFGSDIIALLVEKFLLIDKYRVDVIQCLSEVAGISAATCDTFLPKMKLMFTETIKTIGNLVGENVDFANIYRSTNDENDQNFISSLTIFLTVFLKEYGSRLARTGEEGEVHKFALKLLLKLSIVDNVEVWKMCLEYWVGLTAELYRQNPYVGASVILSSSNEMSPKVAFYLDVLSELRDIIIVKMARPEEVMLVETESGEVVREMVRDTDNINLYKSARECLTYLTFLDNRETIEKMTTKLGEQVTPNGFDRPKLNTLCWAIGSIANTLPEEDEKRFLVVVVRELLSLCEMKRGKDNKAAIAANIMYVVGQYHRFLRAHWKFLKTVILKLFEFMHESHEGVQDMSCDTFMKIVLKCKNMMAVAQPGEAYPFIEEILNNLGAHTCDLTPEQQCIFFEAVGHIIRAVQSEPERINYLNVLMACCTDTWERIIQILAASEQPLQELADKDVSREALFCVRLSAAVCRSFGYEFYVQLTPKFNDMLAVYQLISTGLKSDEISQVDIQIVKNFRAYKKEFLVLMSTWIAQDRSVDRLKSEFFNPLMDAVLFDYNTNTPDTRDAKVLSLLAIIVTRLECDISEFVPAILDSVLDCTIQMITQDMTNFPEHRVNLFQMILAIVTEVFPALLELPDERQNFIMETIYWAFQNSQREVAELGLDITREILARVKKLALSGSGLEKQTAQNFYQKYFVGILEHVFAVLTDKSQVQMLGMTRFGEVICQLFESLKKSVQVPLNAENKPADAYISEYLSGIFTQHYSAQLNQDQIRVFILGFFTFSGSCTEMKNHLKDFLVKLQEQQNGQGLDDSLFITERNAAIAEAQRKEAEKANAVGVAFVDDDEM